MPTEKRQEIVLHHVHSPETILLNRATARPSEVSDKNSKNSMVDIKTNIIINASKNRVSEYAADPDNAPKWYKNIKSVDWKTPKPFGIGSRVAFIAKFLGKELSYIYEVTQFIPGEILVMQTSEGPFSMETTYRWEAIDEKSCRMTLRNAGRPSGFSKLFSPFIKSAMKKANQKDLKLLKSKLENNLN